MQKGTAYINNELFYKVAVLMSGDSQHFVLSKIFRLSADSCPFRLISVIRALINVISIIKILSALFPLKAHILPPAVTPSF